MFQFYYQKRQFISLIFMLIGLQSLMAQDFKAIGYLPYYRFGLNDQIQYEKLTHLNLAFANPDMQGNLSFSGADITPVIEKAHEANVEVFISLAGGALTSDWATAWANLIQPQNRSAFIHKIINYTLQNNFQGIDVDLEWSHVDENYSGFVLELRDSVDQYDLGLTAALPGTYRYPDISSTALAAYDWINMMVYDLTGSWDPQNPGPHSPYHFAVSSINYWVGQGVEQEKLTLGVPFYGYDFSNPNNVHSVTYGQLVEMNPANAQIDQVDQTYYNGIPTIIDKTMLALEEVSGIMIWELGQDSFDEWSLLNNIYEVIQTTVSIKEEPLESSINVFPNPFDASINIRFKENLNGTLMLTDLNGRMLMQQNLQQTSSLNLDTSHLGKGFYVLSWVSGKKSWRKKLVK